MMLSGRSLFRAATSTPAASPGAITVVAASVSGRSAFSSRRYSSSSSSKPSSPPSDGTRSSLPASSSTTSSAAATSTPSRKRMVYGRRQAARMNAAVKVTGGAAASGNVSKAGYATVALPHVPSTEHIQPKDLALSNFFAQHRPVSIGHALPLSFPESHFAKLFEPGNQGIAYGQYANQQSAADVSDYFQPDDNGNVQAVINVNTHTGQATVRPATQQTGSQPQNQHIAIDYLPFHPPPVPQPIVETRPITDRLYVRRQMRKRLAGLIAKYKASTTAPASSRQLSSNFFTPRTPSRIVERNFNPKITDELVNKYDKFIKNPNGRKEQLNALSVKRQRKLKMKKHKYKKLMKKTRTLRRKLENR